MKIVPAVNMPITLLLGAPRFSFCFLAVRRSVVTGIGAMVVRIVVYHFGLTAIVELSRGLG